MLRPTTIKIVRIVDVCDHNGIDYNDMMSILSDTDISFGTNDDTLVSQENLNKIFNKELDYGDCDDTVLISLGS